MMLLFVVLESGPRLRAFGARLPYYSESPRKIRSGSQAEPVRGLEERRCSRGVLIYQAHLLRADWFLGQESPCLRYTRCAWKSSTQLRQLQALCAYEQLVVPEDLRSEALMDLTIVATWHVVDGVHTLSGE